MAKYEIQIKDFYNFDETGFMIDIIISFLIITHSNRYKKVKSIQSNNRKWITVIKCINTLNWCIPPFIIIKGIYHLFN